MKYTYKKCPYCKKQYESYCDATKQFCAHSGSPFVTCKYCGNIFVDKDIKEPALEPYQEPNIFNYLMTGFFPFGIMGIFMTIGAFYAYTPVNVWILIAGIIGDLFYLLPVTVGLIKRKEIQEELRKDYAESQKRLSDPQYIQALINAGVKIPDAYWKTHEK